MDHIYRRDVLDFVTIATEFCKQVEQCAGSERSEFVSVMQRLLPMIYLKASMVEEVEEGFGYVDSVLTEEDYEYVRTQISSIMRDADDYLDVFVESFRYSDAPVVCTVSESLADVYQALRNMVETFRSEIDEAMEVALFDCLEDFKLRWGQLLLGATRAIHEHKVALIQIATPDICFLFRLNYMGFPESLVNLLEDAQIAKVGLSLKDDTHQLTQRHPGFTPKHFIDLQQMASQMGIEDMSLAKLFANFFRQRISKNAQLSNWEADALDEKQRIYAATDASACLLLYAKMQELTSNQQYKLISVS